MRFDEGRFPVAGPPFVVSAAPPRRPQGPRHGALAQFGIHAMTRSTNAAPRGDARKRPPANWRKRFIAHLGETSNVSAAAQAAGISASHVYALRRTDAAFARQWFDALAEGYDNLEMELLEHLRSAGEEADGAARAPARRKFDAATAFRCLAAHRDNVAREKGRRTLDQEVATIAAINAKIDRLRLNGKASDKAIRAARKTSRARIGKGVGDAG